MWDDDYDTDRYYYERPSPYEVERVYVIQRPREPVFYAPPGGKFRFSPTEIRHLAIAYFVLVICFSIVLSTGIGGIFFGLSISLFLFMLPISLIAVFLGFILHEVAHKFAAQHYGCWSEFRYDGRGLLMALFLSIFIGFVYAAPGATWFSGRVTRRENGIISLAGPAVNMITASSFIVITLILLYSANGWFWTTGFIGFIIAFLAMFNLFPIYPLDGSKIWQWNKGIYIVVFAAAIAMVVFFYIAMYWPWYLLGIY